MAGNRFCALLSAIRLVTISFFLSVGLLSVPVLSGQDSAPDAKSSDAQSQKLQPAQTTTTKKRLEHPLHIVPLIMPGSRSPITEQPIAGANVTYFGGPVISNVHVVVVLYGAGSYLPNISSTTPPSAASFFTDIPASSLFDMLTEYSTVDVATVDGLPGSNQTIGHGFFDGQFTITPSAANDGNTITDQQIQTELLNQVAAGNLPQPVLDGAGNNDTLYMIFFPPGKTIMLGNMSSCVQNGFCAYHSSTTGPRTLLYGVMPDMQAPSLCSLGCGGNSPFATVTNVATHELAEATTDANVGNANTVGRPLAWFDPFNGEVGDICQGDQAAITVNGQTYTVQQIFSEFQNRCAVAPPEFVFQSNFSTSPGVEFTLAVFLETSPPPFAGVYSGTVHFTSSDTTAVLPADYTFNAVDNASHSFVLTLNKPGSQTITVTDTARPVVTGTSPAFTVANPAVFALTLAYPRTAVSGTPVNVTISALDVNLHPATSYKGPVHFTSTDGAAVLPADSPLTNGSGTFSVTFKTNGSQTLTVQDASTGTPSASTQSIKVFTPGPNATTTMFTAGQNPSSFGQPVTYSATVTGGSGSFLGTPVSFTVDGASAGSGNVDATGHAQAMLNLAGGTHTVFAEFSGDASHDSSSSAPQTVVVNPVSTSTVVSSSNLSSVFGSNITFTATITSAPGMPPFIPTGVVTLRDGGAPYAILSPIFNQNAGTTINALAVGSHSITANYSGDGNYAPSTSAAITQVITPAPPPPPANYTIQADKNSATVSAGQSATFTITALSVNGFSGDIQFSCGNLPALTTCTFVSPLTFLQANASSITTLTVKTTGPNASLSKPSGHRHYAGLRGRWVLAGFALGVVLLASARRRNLEVRGALTLAVMALLFAAVLTSCGGGSGPQALATPTPTPTPPPQTPAGTTMISVSSNARPADTSPSPANATQQLNLSITVTQ